MGKYMDQARERWDKILADRAAHAKATEETTETFRLALARERVFYEGSAATVEKALEQFHADTGWHFNPKHESEAWRRFKAPSELYVVEDTVIRKYHPRDYFVGSVNWVWGSQWKLCNHDKSQTKDVYVNVVCSLGITTEDVWNEVDKRHDAWQDDLQTMLYVQANAWFNIDRAIQPKEQPDTVMWIVNPTKAQGVKPSELMEVLAASIFMLGDALGEVCHDDRFWPKVNGYANDEVRWKTFVETRDQGFARFMQDLLKRQSEFSSLELNRVEPPKSQEEEEAETGVAAERGVAA